MKKLLTLFAFFITVAVTNAQSISWGFTGRAGAFTTIEKSARQEIEDHDYTHGLGLQAGLGLWISQPLTTAGRVQFTLMQTAERQSSGKIYFVNDYGDSVIEPNVVDYNLAVSSSATYLYQLNKSWALGTGVGGMYEYLSRAKLHVEVMGRSNTTVVYKDEFDNKYRLNLRLYLPLESQYRLTEHVLLVGQVRVPVRSRLAASEAGFKEYDLGLWVGINYVL